MPKHVRKVSGPFGYHSPKSAAGVEVHWYAGSWRVVYAGGILFLSGDRAKAIAVGTDAAKKFGASLTVATQPWHGGLDPGEGSTS